MGRGSRESMVPKRIGRETKEKERRDNSKERYIWKDGEILIEWKARHGVKEV